MHLNKGVILIEALVAMLILSIGMLGLIAMQANLYTRNQDARYRLQASILANELLSMAVADYLHADCYVLPISAQTSCSDITAKTAAQNWLSSVTSALPGTTANPPTVMLDTNRNIIITVFWQRPQDVRQHSYILATRLGS